MPLLGMTKTGEIYEQSSIRDDGMGIGQFPSFADQGQLFLGDETSGAIKNRTHAALIRNSQINAIKLHKKRSARQKYLASRAKASLKASQHAGEQALAAKNNFAKSSIYLKGRGLRHEAEDFSGLMGDPRSGFGEAGAVVKDLNLKHELSRNSGIKKVRQYQGHLNIKERFGVTAPKEVITAKTNYHAHPLALYCYNDAQLGGLFSAIGNAIKNVAKGIKNVIVAPFKLKTASQRLAEAKAAAAKTAAAAAAATARAATATLAAKLAMENEKARQEAQAATQKKILTYALLGVAGLGAIFLVTKIASAKK
jgi:hypothetical protein